MYQILCTRPHAVSVLSWYMKILKNTHWEAVKRILRCLREIADIDLVYDEGTDVGITILGKIG